MSSIRVFFFKVGAVILGCTAVISCLFLLAGWFDISTSNCLKVASTIYGFPLKEYVQTAGCRYYAHRASFRPHGFGTYRTDFHVFAFLLSFFILTAAERKFCKPFSSFFKNDPGLEKCFIKIGYVFFGVLSGLVFIHYLTLINLFSPETSSFIRSILGPFFSLSFCTTFITGMIIGYSRKHARVDFNQS